MEGWWRKHQRGAAVYSSSPDAPTDSLGSLPPTPDTAVEVVHRERSPPAKGKEPMQLVTSESPPVQSAEPSARASTPIRANPATNDAVPLFKASDIEYDPAEPIGSGSFGQVFQGTLQQYKTVAIKVIHFATNEESRRKKLLNEALVMMKSVSRGLSPFVIAFHGYVIDGEFLKLLMEFADLGSLHNYIKDTSLAQQTVPVRTRVAFLHQVSLGMQFLHEHNIHHHDLKSENVLLTQASSSEIIAKISDFGLSRMVEDGLTLSTDFNQHGSLFWKAPERDVWRPVSSPKSDVFSFAVLLTEVILWSWEGVYGFTFDFLWSGGFEPDVCKNIDFRASVFENMDKTCFHANAYSRFGPQLRSIFERCWAVSPNDRPDFEEVSQDLGILLGYEAAMDNGAAGSQESLCGSEVLSLARISLNDDSASNTDGVNLAELVAAGIGGSGAVQAEEEVS
ncbi:kinase-like domain-containing protein [Zopfochytrium polystomum]|nr:kinase-like domain-containing protein [Zopfochytrium polystomum]